jgi:hypothetical protein
MHQTIIVAIYSPLAIVGMMLVITWGMNAAGARRERDGQDVSHQVELCDMCPMKPFVMYGTDGESAAYTSGSVGEKPLWDITKAEGRKAFWLHEWDHTQTN